MKKTVFLLALIFMLSMITPSTYAANANTYKVQIIVEDNTGNTLDVSSAMSLISCGKSVIWTKDDRKQGYGLSSVLDVNPTNQYFEFYSTSYDNISFNLSSDTGDYAFYISDTIKKEELKKDKAIQKKYKLSDLKKIALKTSFMNRNSGRYEVSVVNTANNNYESDNHGSTFEMKPDGSKDLYISPGKFYMAFKYVDAGVCALTYKDNVNTSATKLIKIAREDVILTKYSYKAPKALEDYIYYIMQIQLLNGSYRAYLKGLFTDTGALDLYMDKRISASSQRIVFSMDPDDEYENSVWVMYQNKIPFQLGNSFSPGKISFTKGLDGRQSMEIYFSDSTGNSIHFIDMSGIKDLIVEVYDKKSGEKLYQNTISKYWDYFEPKLKAGAYLARIYPVEKVHGIDCCTYYDLNVSSEYKFIKLFSLKMD
jgi:hypothetical protein